MRKTFYRVDLDWYDNDTNEIVGDMGFTFCDSSETMTEDFDELKSNMIKYANEEIFNAKKDLGRDYLSNESDFPIYSIIKEDFEYDEEDGLPIFENAIDGSFEVLFVCAYCTTERAKKIVDFECDYYAGDFYDESKFKKKNI